MRQSRESLRQKDRGKTPAGRCACYFRTQGSRFDCFSHGPWSENSPVHVCFQGEKFCVCAKGAKGEIANVYVRFRRGSTLSCGLPDQRVSVQLHSGVPAHRRGSVVHRPHRLCADPLFRRGYAQGVRQPVSQRRQAVQRHDLLPGPGHCHRRPGGNRQHRGRLRRHSHRWSRRHLLDVGHRLLRHGYHLC